MNTFEQLLSVIDFVCVTIVIMISGVAISMIACNVFSKEVEKRVLSFSVMYPKITFVLSCMFLFTTTVFIGSFYCECN